MVKRVNDDVKAHFRIIYDQIKAAGYWMSSDDIQKNRSISFAVQPPVAEDGIHVFKTKGGIIQYHENEWSVYLVNSVKEVCCHDVDMVVRTIVDYLSSPTDEELYGLREDDERLLAILRLFQQHQYFARLVDSFAQWSVFFSKTLDLNMMEHVSGEDGIVYYNCHDHTWHFELVQEQKYNSFATVDDIIVYIQRYLSESIR